MAAGEHRGHFHLRRHGEGRMFAYGTDIEHGERIDPRIVEATRF